LAALSIKSSITLSTDTSCAHHSTIYCLERGTTLLKAITIVANLIPSSTAIAAVCFVDCSILVNPTKLAASAATLADPEFAVSILRAEITARRIEDLVVVSADTQLVQQAATSVQKAGMASAKIFASLLPASSVIYVYRFATWVLHKLACSVAIRTSFADPKFTIRTFSALLATMLIELLTRFAANSNLLNDCSTHVVEAGKAAIVCST
jgi:hypothetical protein